MGGITGGKSQSLDAALASVTNRKRPGEIPVAWIVGVSLSVVVLCALGGWISQWSSSSPGPVTQDDTSEHDDSIFKDAPLGAVYDANDPAWETPQAPIPTIPVLDSVSPTPIPGEPVAYLGSNTEGVQSATAERIAGAVRFRNPEFNFECLFPGIPTARSESMTLPQEAAVTRHVLEYTDPAVPIHYRVRYFRQDPSPAPDKNPAIRAYLLGMSTPGRPSLESPLNGPGKRAFPRFRSGMTEDEATRELLRFIDEQTAEVKQQYKIAPVPGVWFTRGMPIVSRGPEMVYDIIILPDDHFVYELEVIVPPGVPKADPYPDVIRQFVSNFRQLTPSSLPKPVPAPAHLAWSAEVDPHPTDGYLKHRVSYSVRMHPESQLRWTGPWSSVVWKRGPAPSQVTTIDLGEGEVIAENANLVDVDTATAVVSPDGRLIASIVEPHTVRVLDVQTGAEVSVLADSAGRRENHSIIFTDPEHLVTLAHRSRDVDYWHVPTGKRIARIMVEGQNPSAITGLSGRRRYLALVNGEFLEVIDLQKQGMVGLARLENPKDIVGLVYSADGNWLASLSLPDNAEQPWKVVIRSAQTGRIWREVEFANQGSRQSISYQGPPLAPLAWDVGWLLCGKHMVLENGRVLAQLPPDPGTNDHHAMRLMLGDSLMFGPTREQATDTYRIHSVGDELYRSVRNAMDWPEVEFPGLTLRLKHDPDPISEPRELPEVAQEPPAETEPPFEPGPRPEPTVAAPQFSIPVENLTLYSTSPWSPVVFTSRQALPFPVTTYDLRTGQKIAGPVEITDAQLHTFTVSPDGKHLAGMMLSDKTRVGLWNLSNGQLVSTFEGTLSPNMVPNVAFTSPNHLITRSAQDNESIVWNIADKTEVMRIRVPGGFPIATITVGRFVALGGGSSVVVADLQRRKVVSELRADRRGAILAVAFSHDFEKLTALRMENQDPVLSKSCELLTWDLVEERIASRLTVPITGFNPGGNFQPLTWLPDDAGWLLLQKHVVTLKGKIAGELPPDPAPPGSPPRHHALRMIFPDGRYLGPTGETSLEGYRYQPLPPEILQALNRDR